jgi:hypothetical protein
MRRNVAVAPSLATRHMTACRLGVNLDRPRMWAARPLHLRSLRCALQSNTPPNSYYDSSYVDSSMSAPLIQLSKQSLFCLDFSFINIRVIGQKIVRR